MKRQETINPDRFSLAMRIAFVTQEFPPHFQGGAGIYADRLVRNLASLGHEVVVFTPLSKGVPNAFVPTERVKIVPISIPGTSFSMISFWLKVKMAVRREEGDCHFDVVHINSITFWFLPTKRIAHAPQVLTIHHLPQNDQFGSRPSFWERWSSGGEDTFLFRRFERHCVRSADRIIAVSNFTKMALAKKYGHEEKLVTIHEAADWPPSSDMPESGWREELGIGGKKVLLFVGRLNDPRKGLDLLLRALAMSPCSRSWALIIVGRGDPSPVVNLSQELGINDRIRILGFVETERLWNLYRRCDICVVPSRLEGFGLTVLDAAAAGRKVVATRVGALPEIGGPGTILVEPNDPEALAKGIEQALSQNDPPEDVIRAYASQFTWLRVAKDTEKVYLDAMAHDRCC